VVKLTVKPTQIDIDLARTTVVVVDMQNEFCSKGGLLDHQGVDVAITQRAIAPTRKVLSAARKAGLKIVYLKMGFHPDLSDVGTPGSRNWINNLDVGTMMTAPNGVSSRILIRDTWNIGIISELRPEPADTLIYKNRFSGSYQTDLDAITQTLGSSLPHRDRMHNQRVRGIDCPGRDVPRLLMRNAGGLHERADRGGVAAKQSRRLDPDV